MRSVTIAVVSELGLSKFDRLVGVEQVTKSKPRPEREPLCVCAVIKAKPFHQGLRFRNHKGGECAASECSLLCKDLSFNGAAQI
eukprot:9418233-Pyramimonas_sp.AAC.1